jgi:hypothetical protein
MKSQNGWPASQNPEAIKIKSYPIPGTEIKVRVAEAAAPLLINFAAEFNERVEKIDKGELDDWGYAFRPVRGSDDPNSLSNHSSGSAIDLNARKHPLGKRDTFTPEQKIILDELCAKYKLRGGYTYKNRPDDMHFEVIVSPGEAKKHIKALGLGNPEKK